MTTADGRMLLAAAGSGLLLLGALGFQYVGGLAPCEMCLWQRWPHVAALAVAAIAAAPWWRGSRGLRALGLVAMLVSAGLALLHVGVEQGWWDGPSTCAVSQGADLTTDQLLDRIVNAPLVRCTEVTWEMLGISMAGWNGLASLALAGLWAAALAADGRGRQGSSSASQ